MKPRLEATAQQTRFNPNVESASHRKELDLHDVTVTVEGRDLAAHVRLKFNAGTKYLLHGINGSGKSSILRAIGERLIPGTLQELKISYLQQSEESDDAGKDSVSSTDSALDLVIKSDIDRLEAIRKRKCEKHCPMLWYNAELYHSVVSSTTVGS